VTPAEMYRAEKRARGMETTPPRQPTPRQPRHLGVPCPKRGDRRAYDAAYYAAHGAQKRAKAREYKARMRAARNGGATAYMENLNPLPCGRSTDA
jgi:hypothetical protein